MLDIETVTTYVCLIAVSDGHLGNDQGHQCAGGHDQSRGLDLALKVHSTHDVVALSGTLFRFPRSPWTCEFAEYQHTDLPNYTTFCK